MKKISIILLTAAMLFTFAACQQEQPVVDVSSITLEKELIAINDSSNDYAVKASVLPENATNKELMYESDNDSILVFEDGSIFLKTTWSESKQYFGKITVTSKMNPSVVRYCYVTVNCDEIKKGALAVKLSAEAEETVDSIDIYGGKSITPVLAVDSNYEMPEATKLDEMFTITSSDSSVVSVDKKTGEITAADKAGTATVTIESNVPYYDEETESYVKAKTEYEVCVNPIRTSEQLTAFLSGTAEAENPTGVNTQKTAYLALPSDQTGLSDVTPVTVSGEKELDLKDKNIQFKNATTSVDFIKVAQAADLTIKGTGTVSGSGSEDFTLINSDGSLKIEGVTLETDSSANKKSQIINLGSGSKSFEITDVDLVANGKTGETTEESKVYAINSEKTEGTVEIGKDVSISVTGGSSAFGIKSKSDVDADKGLSITVEKAKDTKGIDAEGKKVVLTNGSVTISSDKEKSTAVAVSGGEVTITDGKYDITSEENSKLIESTVSALLKKLNTNITVNIIGGNVTIVNGNEGSVTLEGGLYTATATDDESGVAKGFVTDGDVVLKSIDLTVEGASAIGAEGDGIIVENGTYEIEAKGEAVATATATAFKFEGPTCLSSPTVTLKATGVARIADVGDSPNEDAELEVKKGSYSATSTGSDAVAFGSSSDEEGMSVPATFSGAPEVEAIAKEGKACVVDSHSDVTVGKDELNGGSFEATGNNACVFDLENKDTKKENTVDLNNVNATATSSKGEKEKSSACVVNCDNSKLNVSGGTYTAEGDDQSTTFELKNCSESSVNVEKASATGDTTCCVNAEDSDLDALGGEFISESEGSADDDKASGIELKDTNCTILKDAIVKVEAEKKAYGVCIVEEFKPIEINIEQGLDIDVESTDDSAYGIKLDKDSENKVNDLKVNIYDGDINVHASGDEEAIALWNTGELNFENNTDGDVFKGTFEAETNDGNAIGLLNGDFNDTNWEAARSGEKAELEEEGMINVNGESDIKYVATGDPGSPVNNYAGDITVYVNDKPISKGDEFSEEYDTGNGAVLSFSNVSQSSSSYITFTVDDTVNNADKNRKTYQVPEGTTWYQFINNDHLGNNIMEETDEGKIVNSAALSPADPRKYYISLKGKAVKSTDDIEDGAEYYYGSPFVLNTAEGPETVYAEKDSTWKDFVKETYNDYNLATEFKDFTTIVEGSVMGSGKYHIATEIVYDPVPTVWNDKTPTHAFVNVEEDSLEYDGSYYIILDFKVTPSSGRNRTIFIEKDAKWGDLSIFNRSDSAYASYYGEDYVAYKDGEDYIFVKKTDKVDDDLNYEMAIKFSLTTYNGSIDITTEYVEKAGIKWNDFISKVPALEAVSDNNDNYDISYGNAGPRVCESNTEIVKVNEMIRCKDYWTTYTVYYYASPIDYFAQSLNVIAGRTIDDGTLVLTENDTVKQSKFGGWYTSSSYENNTKFKFGVDKINSYLSLYAKQYFDLKIIYILNSAMARDHVNNIYSQYDVQHIYGVDTPLLTIHDYGYMPSITPGYGNTEVFVGWTLKDLTAEVEDGSAYTSVLTNVIPKTSKIDNFIKYQYLEPFVYVYALWIDWNGKFFEYGTEPDINT